PFDSVLRSLTVVLYSTRFVLHWGAKIKLYTRSAKAYAQAQGKAKRLGVPLAHVFVRRVGAWDNLPNTYLVKHEKAAQKAFAGRTYARRVRSPGVPNQ